MWIDNPDSPRIMTDSYMNAGPELRGYMDRQMEFNDIAGRDLRNRDDDILKKSLIEPVTKPYLFEEPTKQIWKAEESVLGKYKIEPETKPQVFAEPKPYIGLRLPSEDTTSFLEPKPSYLKPLKTEPLIDMDAILERQTRKAEEERTIKSHLASLIRPSTLDMCKTEPIIPRYKPIEPEPTGSSILDMCRAKPEPTIPIYKPIEPDPIYISPIKTEPAFDPVSILERQARKAESMLIPIEPKIPKYMPPEPTRSSVLEPYKLQEEMMRSVFSPAEPPSTKNTLDLLKEKFPSLPDYSEPNYRSEPEPIKSTLELLKERFPAPSADPEPIYRPEPEPIKSMVEIARGLADRILNITPKPLTSKPRKRHSNWATFMQDMDKIEKRKKARGANDWDDFMEQFK